jgi:hypothetical protein
VLGTAVDNSMAKLEQAFVGGVLLLVAAACNVPGPRPWLRFEPAGPHQWTAAPDGTWVGRLHGADVAIDLNRTQTRAQVTVTNRSVAPVDIRIGPMAGAPRDAIGQVLLRAIDGQGGVGDPEQPYVSKQRVVVESGWRGTFWLDTPTGGEPQLGTYFVLEVEARNPVGDVERRSLPLIATNAGTMPTNGQ